MGVITDPIADLLTQIRNALHAGYDSVDVPSSKIKINIVKIMKEHGYIKNYKHIDDRKQGILRIYLKYLNGTPLIDGMKRISKPSRRIYYTAADMPRVRNGVGIGIVSTSKGLLTDVQSRKQNIGGELICTIW